MSHFAKVLNKKVVSVIRAEQDYIDTFIDETPGEWIQTSYNTYGSQHNLGGTPLRGNFAGIGHTYNKVNDVFYAPQTYPSWTLNETTWTWEAPTSYPDDDKIYTWNESTTAWVDIDA
mgnify:CR=1 FL=1|jgi:hypothetical protein|tara:strand:- start:558 stop:908 length:351 start_codon:yes stop_codon:yes gene_type:complete